MTQNSHPNKQNHSRCKMQKIVAKDSGVSHKNWKTEKDSWKYVKPKKIDQKFDKTQKQNLTKF